MQPPETVPSVGIFAEAIGLGCLFGLLHAMTESALLGMNGIRPSPLDLSILVATAVCAGVVLGTCIALAALLPRLRVFLGVSRSPLAFRRAAWTIFASAYVLVFLRIVYYWSGVGTLSWLLAVAPALVLAYFAVYRNGQRAAIIVSASALVAATLCALQLVHADWGHVPASDGIFATRLLLPIMLSLVLLVTLMKTTPRDCSFEPIVRGAWLASSLLAVWMVSWVNLNFSILPGSLFRESPSPATPARPNILLIVLDTVRADHLDLFGYERETMPNLKRFALEQAQVANRTPTPGSWTVPSHAAMFTGLYPSAHGAHYPFVGDKNPRSLASSIRGDTSTLAEFLVSQNYQTAGIGANYAMLPGYGLPRGFEHYDVIPGAGYFAAKILWMYRFNVLGPTSLGERVSRTLPFSLQGRSKLFSALDPKYRRASEINLLAKQWLTRHQGRPFFLFLNYMDAHDPYLPLPEDDERFFKRPPGESWLGFPKERFAAGVRGEGNFTHEEIEFMKGQYDAELVALDRELGRLFEYLRAAGLFENTVIFITPDHGEAFFEHGFPEHGNSVYQPETDGFLLIKIPPPLGAAQAAPTMQSVDIFPTICSLINEPIPNHMQGSPWGRDRRFTISEVFCKACALEHFGDYQWPESLRRDLIGVTIDGLKLIRSTHKPDEVYDLNTDWTESKEVVAPPSHFVVQAEEIIAERNKSLVEELSRQPEDEHLLEKLRSLGYIQ